MVITDLGNLFSGTAEALCLLGKDKNSEAWSKIVKIHGVGMLNTARGVLGDYSLAEDAVQNAFLQIRDLSEAHFKEFELNSKGIFSSIQRENAIFNNDFAARNWIIRITYFVAKNMKKSLLLTKEREKVFTQNWVEERENRSTSDQEILAVLQKEIEKLPDDLRLPLVLRFHCDMNFNQVSSELGLAVHVIRQRVQKGIEVLQTKISAIVGSSMPAISVESLLNNVFSLNEGLADSLFKSCADLLDKPALTKMQLIPENKLLLQSSKFMVKGLVMLKVLAILVVIVGTAVLVVNSIQSNESIKDKEAKEKELALEKIGIEGKNSVKKKVENPDQLVSKDKESNESNVAITKPTNSVNVFEIKATEKVEITGPAEKEKSGEFDINEILPYFSDKAMFTMILPDINKSTVRFKNSTVSKFYADPRVDLLGKMPLILKSQLNIEVGGLSGDMFKTIVEKTFQSLHCMGVQYYENEKNKTNSFFMAGLIKNEKSFILILESIKPFLKKTKKTEDDSEIYFYQVSEDMPQIVLIKKGNKIFFGNTKNLMSNNLSKNTSVNFLSKASLTLDMFWNSNATFVWKYLETYLSETIGFNIEKESKYFDVILGIKFLQDFSGEITIQSETITHKVDVNLKEGTQRGIWDIFQFRKITSEMMEKIPEYKVEYVCLNLDLQKSWENYNVFMHSFFKGEKEFREDYEEMVASFNKEIKAVFQMDLNSLMSKCLTGEIVCWISSNQELNKLNQVMGFRIKENDFAKKLVKGLEFYALKEGLVFSLDEKYIHFSFPVVKSGLNKNYQKALQSKNASSFARINFSDKIYSSWVDSNFSLDPGLFFLMNFADLDTALEAEGKIIPLLELCSENFHNNATLVSFTKNQLTLEMQGSNDFVNLFLLNFLLNEKNNNIGAESLKYTEYFESYTVNALGKPTFDDNSAGNKVVQYISAKGYLLNGMKTGLWINFNEKGEIIGEGKFIKGKEVGFWKLVEYEGKCEGEMVDGFKTGHWLIEYWDKKKSEGEMKLGKKSGVWKTFYENKILESEGEFIEDEKVGLWKYYHDNGAKSYEWVLNKNGRIVDSEVIKWDKEGNICANEKYAKGRLDGNSKHFENKELLDEAEYKDGVKLWSKSYFPNQGHLANEYIFDTVKGVEYIKRYYSNGQLELTKQNIKPMKNGLSAGLFAPSGEWRGWYENGTKKLVANFDENSSGLKTEYFENGNKCVEFHYKNGLKDGKAEGWYENGNPFFTGRYYKGEIVDRWTIWYLNGSKKAEGEWKYPKVFFGWQVWKKTGELEKDIGGGVWPSRYKLFDMVKEMFFLTAGNNDEISFVDKMINIRAINSDFLEKKLDTIK